MRHQRQVGILKKWKNVKVHQKAFVAFGRPRFRCKVSLVPCSKMPHKRMEEDLRSDLQLSLKLTGQKSAILTLQKTFLCPSGWDSSLLTTCIYQLGA